MIQTKPKFDDCLFPFGKLGQCFFQKLPLHFVLQIPVDNVFIRSQDIRQQQFISVPVHIERFIDGYFHAHLAVPKIHQNLIFNTAGRIGCQFDVLTSIKGIDGFDQPDGTDGNQILHSNPCIVELFRNVYYQPQIVFDQFFSCLLLLIGLKSQDRPILLFSIQRRRQNLRSADVMDLSFL